MVSHHVFNLLEHFLANFNCKKFLAGQLYFMIYIYIYSHLVVRLNLNGFPPCVQSFRALAGEQINHAMEVHTHTNPQPLIRKIITSFLKIIFNFFWLFWVHSILNLSIQRISSLPLHSINQNLLLSQKTDIKSW